jgi:hypothetical protein
MVRQEGQFAAARDSRRLGGGMLKKSWLELLVLLWWGRRFRLPFGRFNDFSAALLAKGAIFGMMQNDPSAK